VLVVFTTVETDNEAHELASKIVDQKLAACVQVLPPMTSFYFWKGKTEKATERLLLIKTLEENFDALSDFLNSEHSYDVPEIVAVKAERVSEAYGAWMKETLT
jgi:periplasmic divalent cation tolerance protein